METKKFEIDWQGKKEEVEIKRLGYGDLSTMIARFTKTSIGENKVVKTEIDFIGMKPIALISCIVKAPFKCDNNYIYKELDPSIGEFIYKKIEEFNKITEIQKKKLKEQSSGEQKTPN